ncbi:MAG: hypothetical protein PHH60_04620 [Candidatus Margulisbacteria bacterium]|nr:hypothetical protein [Candidatus Margulisiibacteriota bacterium]
MTGAVNPERFKKSRNPVVHAYAALAIFQAKAKKGKPPLDSLAQSLIADCLTADNKSNLKALGVYKKHFQKFQFRLLPGEKCMIQRAFYHELVKRNDTAFTEAAVDLLQALEIGVDHLFELAAG